MSISRPTSASYYYDADAVREDARYGYSEMTGAGKTQEKWAAANGSGAANPTRQPITVKPGNGGNRNLRSVWTIATEPYPGAHFATFPRKLVEPCVKAGTSERGVCAECGAPWLREVEQTGTYHSGQGGIATREGKAQPNVNGRMRPPTELGVWKTTGWRPSCDHDAATVPATVLDPFAGSGTTLLVAQSLGRRGVGIDLNPDYLRQALARNAQAPLGLEVTA